MTTSRRSFASCARMRILLWCQIRNSYARGQQSRISNIQIASWLAPMTNGRAWSCAKCTGRFSSTKRQFSSPNAAPRNSSNMRPMRFLPRRSPSSMKWLTFAKSAAQTCRRSHAEWRRIAAKFLHAGPGFGGSCFPKDLAALAAIGQRYDVPSSIVATVMAVNDGRKRAMAAKVLAACGGSLDGKIIAVLGLTFKPNTDDMREAPSLVIVPTLEAHGARVRAYDPHGMAEARKLMPRLETAADPYACIEGADAMLILTGWDQFPALGLDRVKNDLRSPIVVDLRNIYRPSDVAAKGLTYVSVGRG